MSEELTVHGYPHGGSPGTKPRKPMVHVIAIDAYRGVQAMTFHPDDAESITRAILKAAHAARRGRKVKPTKIKITPHD